VDCKCLDRQLLLRHQFAPHTDVAVTVRSSNYYYYSFPSSPSPPPPPPPSSSSSSSIGTATLVGYALINYRWVFSAGRFLQSAVASGTSHPELGGPVIRKFQLPLPDVPHVWSDASEPQQRKVELWARICREFCRKLRLRHFWAQLAPEREYSLFPLSKSPMTNVRKTSCQSPVIFVRF